MRVPAWLLISCLIASPALAAPWDTGVLDPDDPAYIAFQFDPATGAILMVECYYDLASYGIWVIADEPWDATASYAPNVAPVFMIDGTPVVSPSFTFYEFDGQEGIAANDFSEQEAFFGLLDAIYAASESISVSYFDKRASFSAEGVIEAIGAVEWACEE